MLLGLFQYAQHQKLGARAQGAACCAALLAPSSVFTVCSCMLAPCSVLALSCEFVHKHVWMYACMHVSRCICMCVYMCMCVYACMLYVCMCVCIYVCMCARARVRACLHVWILLDISMYTRHAYTHHSCIISVCIQHMHIHFISVQYSHTRMYTHAHTWDNTWGERTTVGT